MYEGVVPFAGDSAVSVAYLHVREPVKAPSQRRRDLSPALEAIILTCLAKDPVDRYQSADQLRADLLRFQRGQAPIGGPATAAVAAVGEPTIVAARPAVAPATAVVSAVAGTSAAGPPRRKGSRGPVALVVVLLLALIGLVAFLLVQVFANNGPAVKTVTVRGVIGLTEAKARQTLIDQGFKVTTTRQPNQKPVGTVFDQNPQEGEFKKTGTAVTIFVSDGAGTVSVPKVEGLEQAIAASRLTKRGFVVTPVPELSETVKAGTAIRTDPPAGKKLEPGSNVNLIVSAGPAPIPVPDVVGRDQSDATQQLVAAGFRVSKTTEPSRTVAKDRVIRTQPGSGQPQPKDSTITIVVSTGTKQTPVPDVVGKNQSDAVSALDAAGFQTNVSQAVSTGANIGKVISQTPAAGTIADDGSTVTITVGIAAPTTTTSPTTTTTPKPPPPTT